MNEDELMKAEMQGWNDAMRCVMMDEPNDWQTSPTYAAYLRGQDQARM